MSDVSAEADLSTGAGMVEACRRHTLFEWSAQSHVDPIPMARAKGVHFWTPEGKRYIDFNSQLMCVNIGHGHERVITAIQEQAAQLAYANPFMASEPRAPGVKLAEICPGDIDAFFFTNGGSEANENAVRTPASTPAVTGLGALPLVSRRHRRQPDVDGRPRRWPSEPGMPGVVRLPHPYHGIERGWDSTEKALADIEEIIELEGPTTVAALILEPVTGTNGVLSPPPGYLEGIRALCTATASS